MMRPTGGWWLLQVAKLPLRTLEAHFGDRATWIHDAVRGISDDPVQVSHNVCIIRTDP